MKWPPCFEMNLEIGLLFMEIIEVKIYALIIIMFYASINIFKYVKVCGHESV